MLSQSWLDSEKKDHLKRYIRILLGLIICATGVLLSKWIIIFIYTVIIPQIKKGLISYTHYHDHNGAFPPCSYARDFDDCVIMVLSVRLIFFSLISIVIMIIYYYLYLSQFSDNIIRKLIPHGQLDSDWILNQSFHHHDPENQAYYRYDVISDCRAHRITLTFILHSIIYFTLYLYELSFGYLIFVMLFMPFIFDVCIFYLFSVMNYSQTVSFEK
jgi:hypothetical protein